MANQIYCIEPWKAGRVWLFTDEERGLVMEPLVAGIPEIIQHYAGEDATNVQILFSSEQFKGAQSHLAKLPDQDPRYGGTDYVAENGMVGWLCPALLEYFETPPEKLWFSVTR